MPISVDEAISLLVEKLRLAPPLSATHAPNARPRFGCDVLVTDVFTEWWFREHRHNQSIPDPGEADYASFHDASWELARRGILRIGPAFPAHNSGGSNTPDGFSLTEMGRDWIMKYDQQGPFPADPARFATLLSPYTARFGPAFNQRITEAAGCYRTLNYFAACAMAGAACEAILLTVASAKIGDEEKARHIYNGRDGRRMLIREISATARPVVKQAVETATSLLSYWRDNAAHGYATAISEFAAHDALSRLLRFAQFVDQHWSEVTEPAGHVRQ